MITELVETITATEIVETDSGTILEVQAPGVVTVLEGGTQGPEGITGPQGIQGPQGPAGTGGDLTYVHNQLSASSVWSVVHNLNKYPSVMIVDSGNSVVIGDVQYIDANNLTLNFVSAFGGKAYLN